MKFYSTTRGTSKRCKHISQKKSDINIGSFTFGQKNITGKKLYFTCTFSCREYNVSNASRPIYVKARFKTGERG